MFELKFCFGGPDKEAFYRSCEQRLPGNIGKLQNERIVMKRNADTAIEKPVLAGILRNNGITEGFHNKMELVKMPELHGLEALRSSSVDCSIPSALNSPDIFLAEAFRNFFDGNQLFRIISR